MRKFLQTCMAIVGILAVIGIVFCVWGNQYGGMEQFREWIENGEFSIGPGGSNFISEKMFDIDDVTSFDKNYEVLSGDVAKLKVNNGAYNELRVEVGGGIITLLPSGDENIYVEAQGVGKLQAYQQDNRVYVKSIKTKKTTGDISVFIPNDISLSTLALSVGAGTIDLSQIKLNAYDINLNVGAGRIVTGEIAATNSMMEVGAGGIELEKLVAKNWEASVGMGSISGEIDVSKSMDLECAMGNIDIIQMGQFTDFNYTLECAAGNISIGQNQYTGVSVEKEVDNGADKYCDLECSMGNIHISFE